MLLSAGALSANADDGYGAGHTGHCGLLSVGGRLTPFRGIRSDR